MTELFGVLKESVMTINWEGPAAFVVVGFAILALFRQWSVLLLTIFTIVLGWGAQDMMIMNLESESRVISMPLLIYCIGGGIALILILISFLKSSLK